jgi:TDG/mug DNA glycosylase family protein
MTPTHQSPGLPDILARDLAVVFCGIKPGLGAAAAGHHFVGRGNRFWKTIHLAGFTPELIAPANDRHILRYGCGLTTAVERPTSRADEVARPEFEAAHKVLGLKIQQFAPRYIAFLGKAAYCAISGRRNVAWGRQAEPFAGTTAWILPNPSGLNRAFSLDLLVQAYRELHEAAA